MVKRVLTVLRIPLVLNIGNFPGAAVGLRERSMCVCVYSTVHSVVMRRRI